MVGADGEEAGVLALGAGVGLEGEGVVAGDVAEPLLEVGDHLGVAEGLVARGEGMEVAELRPGDGDHLGGGVELHGAGAEGDHGAVEGEVAVGEAAHVAEHFGLGVVLVEDGVGEEGAGAPEVRRGWSRCASTAAKDEGRSPKQDQSVSMSSGVVVSSREMPMRSRAAGGGVDVAEVDAGGDGVPGGSAR